MTQHRISILFIAIILIACLTSLFLNMTGGTSIIDSPNHEFISSNTKSLEPTEKAEEILTTPTDTANSKTILETVDRHNGQMLNIQRPNWKFDGQFIVQLEKLKSAATDKNNEASYILAMNLRYCMNSPIDDIALEKKLEQAYEFSDSELAVGEITKKYQYCSGIEQKQRNQFYSYSKAAANNGYVAAQEVIGSITPEFFMLSQGHEDLERDEFIVMRDNFIEQQIQFLERAAQNGSIRALVRLANMNRSQQVGGNGYVKSFAFNQLILELTQNNEIYNRYSWFQQKLYEQLTAEEVNDAFAMSEEWLAIIKANGTLYLHEN